MFFEIGALKNVAIFWHKKSLQHRCFLVNIAKFLRTAFLQNFSGGCFCIISKVIKRYFAKSILKKYSCYDILIFFSSQHVLEKVELVCSQLCRQFPGFLYNFIRVYSVKLKIGMPHEHYFSKLRFLGVCQCAFNHD